MANERNLHFRVLNRINFMVCLQ